MRMLVKLPGPRPTTIRSIWAGSSTSSSTARRRSPARGVCARRSGVRAQTAPKEVEVSKAKIVVVTVDPHPPVRLVDVNEPNGRARVRQPVAAVLRPLDERHGAVEIWLEVAPLLRVDGGEAVEVEVRHRHGGLVAVADRERRARDRLAPPPRPRRAPGGRWVSRAPPPTGKRRGWGEGGDRGGAESL